jgi:hypothetical protein
LAAPRGEPPVVDTEELGSTAPVAAVSSAALARLSVECHAAAGPARTLTLLADVARRRRVEGQVDPTAPKLACRQ